MDSITNKIANNRLEASKKAQDLSQEWKIIIDKICDTPEGIKLFKVLAKGAGLNEPRNTKDVNTLLTDTAVYNYFINYIWLFLDDTAKSLIIKKE
jgi:hypothetical protein